MENIGNIGIASVAAITVICYLVGLIVKAVPNMADKYIPIFCGVAVAFRKGKAAFEGVAEVLYAEDNEAAQ